MARIVQISLTLVLLLTTIINETISRPIAKSDLIDGSDFLSLFIRQNNKSNQKDNSYEHLDTSKSASTNSKDELNERILSIETIYSKEDELLVDDSNNFELRTQKRLRNHKSHQMKENFNDKDLKESITTPFADITDTPHKQIVKMVTSGSKIIFLEEITPAKIINNERNLSNPLMNEMRNREIITNVKANLTSASDGDNTNYDQAKNEKPNNSVDFKSLHGNKNHLSNKNSEKIDFINRSHKSEFSIEEIEPVTQESLSDSVNVESTNIHSILAPPSNINQSPSHHNIVGTRMQRKQDKLVPFQTVIYHDTNYQKDGTTQPRSVSYSSIAQSIDELNSWKDLEGLLEAKENVSQGFRQQIFSDSMKVYGERTKVYSEPSKIYGQPAKFYSEPAKVYSEPAKVYSQSEKQYGEPAKVYSEPAKVYSEPAKVYSQPAKMYGEPSKVYWPPSTPTVPPLSTTKIAETTTENYQAQLTTKTPHSRKVIFNLDKLPYDLLNAPETHKKLLEPNTDSNKRPVSASANKSVLSSNSHVQKSEDPNNFVNHQDGTYHLVTQRPKYSSMGVTETQEIFTPTPEQNYEIEESVSVMTNGRAHGLQQSSIPTTTPSDDDSKIGYVVEGRNYRKYRVEEKTPDGFIVGEYGVVSHNDGSLRGVRYTADSNINPSLIHEALMKFLSL